MIPHQRQPHCVYLDKNSCLNLRELIMPAIFNTQSLAFKLFEAGLRMEMEEKEAINVSFTLDDCLIVNALVKNNHWPGSQDILLQTWQVAHELHYGAPLRPHVTMEVEIVEEEAEDAVHRHGGSAAGEDGAEFSWRT